MSFKGLDKSDATIIMLVLARRVDSVTPPAPQGGLGRTGWGAAGGAGRVPGGALAVWAAVVVQRPGVRKALGRGAQAEVPHLGEPPPEDAPLGQSGLRSPGPLDPRSRRLVPGDLLLPRVSGTPPRPCAQARAPPAPPPLQPAADWMGPGAALCARCLRA